jgi:hypothetical protein
MRSLFRRGGKMVWVHGIFFIAPQNALFVDQLSHAFHHNYTTKSPRPAPIFAENPAKRTHPPQAKIKCKKTALKQ